jgi:hypothetical protein
MDIIMDRDMLLHYIKHIFRSGKVLVSEFEAVVAIGPIPDVELGFDFLIRGRLAITPEGVKEFHAYRQKLKEL